MDGKKYTELIRNSQTDDTKKIIGEIDTKFLESDKPESMYYSFPLIEKMIIEIFKLVPDSDIEGYEQGIMRTPIEVINANNENKVISDDLTEKIVKYFNDDGARNKIFHVESEELCIKVKFEEINYIIYGLLEILKKLIDEYSAYDYNDIAKL